MCFSPGPAEDSKILRTATVNGAEDPNRAMNGSYLRTGYLKAL